MIKYPELRKSRASDLVNLLKILWRIFPKHLFIYLSYGEYLFVNFSKIFYKMMDSSS